MARTEFWTKTFTVTYNDGRNDTHTQTVVATLEDDGRFHVDPSFLRYLLRQDGWEPAPGE